MSEKIKKLPELSAKSREVLEVLVSSESGMIFAEIKEIVVGANSSHLVALEKRGLVSKEMKLMTITKNVKSKVNLWKVIQKIDNEGNVAFQEVYESDKLSLKSQEAYEELKKHENGALYSTLKENVNGLNPLHLTALANKGYVEGIPTEITTEKEREVDTAVWSATDQAKATETE